jgi:hypothetical protein
MIYILVYYIMHLQSGNYYHQRWGNWGSIWNIHTHTHTQNPKQNMFQKLHWNQMKTAGFKLQTLPLSPYSYQINSSAFNMSFDVDVSVVNFTGYWWYFWLPSIIGHHRLLYFLFLLKLNAVKSFDQCNKLRVDRLGTSRLKYLRDGTMFSMFIFPVALWKYALIWIYPKVNMVKKAELIHGGHQNTVALIRRHFLWERMKVLFQ